MGKTAKKKGDKGAVSATQKKVQKLAERKKKQEEMKQVLQSLKQNQLSQSVLEHLESARDIGQKRKLKDLDKDHKNKKNSVDILDKKKAESEEEEDSEEEEEKVEKEADEPVNIFAMASYENKKVKTEEKSAKPRKSFDEMELEATEKIIREEREANLTINPFKEYKKKLLQGDEPDDDKEEEQKKTENFADIFDEELKQFVQGTSAKYNQPIQRSEADTKAREKLPIFLREFDIIESINNNLITIISGETGSGKSTQVPQFLYERGYSNPEGPNPGKIGITQPRRIAAIALAKRVATEMGSELGQTVAFQVRHESSSLNENNRIKFMTDGILLREMTTDFLLSQYSVIMIDEAHERKVNTDILIGLLSRVVNVRFKLTKEERARKGPDYQGKYDHYPLRLLIMSATLRVKDFTENKFLFPKPVCTINVESRQYPLTVFFSKVTKDDYFQEAIKKCVKIHQKLPAGGILVFMTGEKEIRDFCHALQEKLKKKKKNPEFEEEEETEKDEEGPKSRMKMLDLEGGDLSDNEEEPEYLNENPQEDQAREDLKNAVAVSLKPIVVPLYSKLPLHEQEKIFNNIEENSRLIVVSTNVAETSLTIPGMKYVIDTGKEKKKIYDDKLSISHYKIDWIARASADQRAGRAARVGPGYCYRLYSRAVCGNIMAEYRDPEILNMPLENIVLQLKAVGIRDTMKFPFPTRPDVTNIRFALKNLLQLKAVEPAKNKSQIQVDSQDGSDLLGAAEGLSEDNTNITELGNALSYIPIAPRFAKMILMGRKEGCFAYSVLIAAGLSVEEIFHNENQSLMLAELMGEGKEQNTGVVKQKFAKKYERFITGGSDLFTIMNILGEFIKFLYVRVPKLDIIEKLESAINDFALMYTLIAKNLKAIFLNLRQLINIFETLLENDTEKKEMINSFKDYKQPTSAQTNKLQEILTAISINKVARKVKRNQKTLKSDFIYEVIDHDVEVHIHPNSCLKGASPDFLIYDELIFTNKYMMRNVTKISDLKWLLKYDEIPNRKIELLSDPKPFYSRKKGEVIVFASATFGPKNWSIPCFEHHFEEDDYKKYIWFTRSLLDGQVVLGFKDLKPYYGAPVETIKEFNMAPKASRIVNKLKNSGIDTHQKLLAKWKQDIKFLQDEILQWCKPEEKQKIVKSWLNIIKE